LNLNFAHKVAKQGVLVPRFETQVEPFTATGKKMSGYSVFEVKGMSINAESLNPDLDVVWSGGKKEVKVEFLRANPLIDRACVAL
jgi:hypothetical protein